MNLKLLVCSSLLGFQALACPSLVDLNFSKPAGLSPIQRGFNVVEYFRSRVKAEGSYLKEREKSEEKVTSKNPLGYLQPEEKEVVVEYMSPKEKGDVVEKRLKSIEQKALDTLDGEISPKESEQLSEVFESAMRNANLEVMMLLAPFAKQHSILELLSELLFNDEIYQGALAFGMGESAIEKIIIKYLEGHPVLIPYNDQGINIVSQSFHLGQTTSLINAQTLAEGFVEHPNLETLFGNKLSGQVLNILASQNWRDRDDIEDYLVESVNSFLQGVMNQEADQYEVSFIDPSNGKEVLLLNQIKKGKIETIHEIRRVAQNLMMERGSEDAKIDFYESAALDSILSLVFFGEDLPLFNDIVLAEYFEGINEASNFGFGAFPGRRLELMVDIVTPENSSRSKRYISPLQSARWAQSEKSVTLVDLLVDAFVKIEENPNTDLRKRKATHVLRYFGKMLDTDHWKQSPYRETIAKKLLKLLPYIDSRGYRSDHDYLFIIWEKGGQYDVSNVAELIKVYEIILKVEGKVADVVEQQLSYSIMKVTKQVIQDLMNQANESNNYAELAERLNQLLTQYFEPEKASKN